MNSIQQLRLEERRRSKAQREKETRFVLPGCQICGFSGYSQVMELHHLHPIGETNSPTTQTIWLCPNCHTLVHKIRSLFIRHRPLTKRLHKLIMSFDCWLEEGECRPETAKRLFEVAGDSLPKDWYWHTDQGYIIRQRLKKTSVDGKQP